MQVHGRPQARVAELLENAKLSALDDCRDPHLRHDAVAPLFEGLERMI
jgi:hypothetical protein